MQKKPEQEQYVSLWIMLKVDISNHFRGHTHKPYDIRHKEQRNIRYQIQYKIKEKTPTFDTYIMINAKI